MKTKEDIDKENDKEIRRLAGERKASYLGNKIWRYTAPNGREYEIDDAGLIANLIGTPRVY